MSTGAAIQARYNEFYQLMEELLDYGEEKHGAASFQAIVASGKIERTDRLRNCLFHSAEHIKAYNLQEPHDKFGTLEHQLAAVAVNAMMEFILMKEEQKTRAPMLDDSLTCPHCDFSTGISVILYKHIIKAHGGLF